MNKIQFRSAEINLRLNGPHPRPFPVLRSQKCDHNQRRSEVSVVTVGVDAVEAALPRGHDRPPQSPDGSLLATPAAPSAPSG